MKREEISELMPGEVLKRIHTAPSIVVVGPSTSGKSTMVYALVNHRLTGFINVGIGDKSQTTIIPCNFLFDERIEKNEHFAIRVKTKHFAEKDIHIEVLEQLSKLYAINGASAQDTMDAMDCEWFHNILEPEKASYHLGKMVSATIVDEFMEVIKPILYDVEKAEPSFDNRVKTKKKEYAQQKVKISEIRRMVFEEIWEEMDYTYLEPYFNWMRLIGKEIKNNLNLLLGDNGLDNISEYSTQQDDIFTYGGIVLQKLFDPYEAYSLVIEEITLACRPRTELIQAEDKIPLRFCLRDTMGLTQIGVDSGTIKDALDIALNCSPESILLLMNLEERDDVISASCDAIAEKFKKAEKLDVPVHVVFTKADKILDNLIYKEERETVDIKQSDYDAHIMTAVAKMEESIKRYLSKLPQNNATWLSLRFKEQDIDSIQIALNKHNSDKVLRFTPSGLYQNIIDIIKDTQRRILPKGVTNPLFVTPLDYDKPAVLIKVDVSQMKDVLNNIQTILTQDKAIVNGYLITTKYRVHGRSVVNYYRNLQNGQGYSTRAKVYGNFSINMKAMLNNILCNNIPKFLSLYEEQAVNTIVDNLNEKEMEKMIRAFEFSDEITEIAYTDINPAILKEISEKSRMSQKLHYIFKYYFSSSEKYYMVMNKVDFNLSYGNEKIKEFIDKDYRKPISYDETIRKMQETFNKIFGSQEFADIIVEELGNAMTDLVNKMFIVI